MEPVIFKSYWHIQSIPSKDWLRLKSEAALYDIQISLLTTKKSQFPGFCVAYSKTFSNHFSLVKRFNQITNNKMILLLIETGDKFFPACYGLNTNSKIPILEFIKTSFLSTQTLLSSISYPMINTSLLMFRKSEPKVANTWT